MGNIVMSITKRKTSVMAGPLLRVNLENLPQNVSSLKVSTNNR